MLQHEKKFVTPAGIAVYPHLVTPDEYEGSLDYKVTLKLNPEDKGVSELIADITALADAELERAVAEMKAKGGKSIKAAGELKVNYPFEEEVNDAGDETGMILLRAKSKAAGVGKKGPWARKIPLFDAQPKPIKHGSIDIWSGSVLKLELKTNVYTAPGLKLSGVSFYIESVQVLQLSNGNSGGMFGAEEGGYTDEGSSHDASTGAAYADADQDADDAGDY